MTLLLQSVYVQMRHHRPLTGLDTTVAVTTDKNTVHIRYNWIQT